MKPNAAVMAKLDKNVIDVITNNQGRRHTKKSGEVGIEIEVEGRNLLPAPSKYWNNIPDGSLRGESAEYVLAAPISRRNVRDALNLLSNELVIHGSVINDSYRTSVHVHLNMLGFSVRQLFNMMCLYLTVEDALIDFCGQERVGNLFCLRAKDAEYLPFMLAEIIRTGRFNQFGHNDLRYAAMNVKALVDHGSLEFRAFRGTVNPVLINQWVEMLLEIKDKAERYQNPQEICKEFSLLGPIEFLRSVFSQKNLDVILHQKGLEAKLLEGVRITQDIAYSLPDWTKPAAPVEGAAPELDEYFEPGAPQWAVNVARPQGFREMPPIAGAGGGGFFQEIPLAGGGVVMRNVVIADDMADDIDDIIQPFDDEDEDDF